MATNHGVDQSNTMLRHIDGTAGAPPPSQRDLRAIRRGEGVPVPTPANQDFLTEGRGLSKREMDSDTEFEESSDGDHDVTSVDDDYVAKEKRATDHRNTAGKSNTRRANTGRAHNILLQDSNFSADRTNMRLWHELRYARNMWSREEEDQLRKDCAAITDGDEIPSTSNSVLWTASFDRYGVPLSDIFTYGLRPHPDNLRLARKKLLSPQFCDHLTSVMVHPIFQGDAATLRYVLQLIVRIRVGMHVPPMGTMPDMDNANLDKVDLLDYTLIMDEDTPEEREMVHADAYLLVSQKQGPRFHPDIVILEDLLVVHFAIGGHEHTAPRDDAPYSRSLFYLQLWDLQFLLDVLNGLSSRGSYLPVDKYKAMWINLTPKIQVYIANKLDSLVQQWFLSDERNYRIRQNLKDKHPGKRLYDIPEEDFNPTYARSHYVTEKMRAVLEGKYLEALCPPQRPGMPVAQNTIAEDPVFADTSAESPAAESPVAESADVQDADDTEEEEGNGIDTVQSAVNVTPPPREMPVRASMEEDDATTITEVTARDDQQASPEADIKLEAKDSDDGGSYDGDPDDTVDGDEPSRSPSETASLVSVHSITSSKAVEDQQDSPYGSPEQGYFARRGMPPLGRK